MCKQNNKSNKIIIINFFVLENKVIMSGPSGSGTYDIVERNSNGVLAFNVSIIGKDYGIETILLNEKKRLFFFKTKLSSDKSKKVYSIEGECSIF